ncbi:hypothetical protein PV433_33630 [Paenibacillus sp. GYB004]|uniref:VOC family protein n=1 Tax=Paenibacillus sp. GYB004 TaxID=2994393 RepID=UPI002F96A828
MKALSTSNPLLNQVNSVFIHVTDMPKAVEWYSKLLGRNETYQGSSDDRTVFGSMKEAYDYIRGLGIQPYDDDDNDVTEEDIRKDPFLFRIRDPFDA